MMKKKEKRNWMYGLAGLALTVLVVMFCPNVVQAEEMTDGNGLVWDYQTLDSGEGLSVRLAGDGAIPNALRGKVTIPSEIGGVSVKELQSDAFYYNELLTEVTIPDSITTIGVDAFRGCSALKKVTYNTALMENIGSGAFNGCSKLESFSFPTNALFNTITEGVLNDCTKISSITIPSQVYRIENSAFANSGIQSIVIPNTVTWMGNSVLYECSKLTSVTLPSNEDITEIPQSTFGYCAMLKTVSIPNTYTTIGKSAFAYSAVTGLYFPSSITDVEEEACYNCSDLQVIQFASPTVPSFNGSDHFAYTSSMLKILTPLGMADTYKTTMLDADNTLKIPDNAEFVGKDTKVTVVPLLSGEIMVSGKLYAGQPISNLKLSGTFLNAFDNTNISGTLSWEEPSKTFSEGYASEELKWNFTPDTAYGAGAMKVSGMYSYSANITAASIDTGKTDTNTNGSQGVIQNTANKISSLVKLGKPTLKSVKKKGSKKVTVTWKKKVKNASGYQIAVSTKRAKGYKVKKTVKKASAKSAVLTGLKKGKTYYIKVRAFATVSGVRIYGGYSKVKKVKR